MHQLDHLSAVRTTKHHPSFSAFQGRQQLSSAAAEATPAIAATMAEADATVASK